MSTEQCDEDIYKNGISVGIFAMSKEAAEEFCAARTQLTGIRHDWHYVAGRVHVKAENKSKTEKQEALKRMFENLAHVVKVASSELIEVSDSPQQDRNERALKLLSEAKTMISFASNLFDSLD